MQSAVGTLSFLLSIHTLCVAIQYDQFGIEQLYKSVDNGLNFEPGWNTVDRTVNAVDVDTYSTEQKCHARGGNSIFDIDSTTGVMTMDGDTPRYYCYLDHTNVEVTAYAKRGSESSYKSYQGLTIVARSTHKDYSDDYCKAKGYYFRLYNDGRACFLKEFIHSSSCLIYTASSNNPCVNSFDSSSSNGGVTANKWYGMKLVIQNDEINNAVNLRGYVDFTDGLNGGNWQLILEYNDTNKWIAEVESSEQWCMDNCGYNGNEHWSQQSNSIFLRSSYVNNYQWKYFTIREIIPFTSSDTVQGPTSNPVTAAPITADLPTLAPVNSPTKTPITSTLQYIVIENHDSTQEYYLSFVLKNTDASACSDSISDVQIKEENVWRSYDQIFTGGRYSFQKQNVKFTDELPISVRIVMTSDTEIILSNIITDLIITSVFVTDQLICQQLQTPTSTPSSSPEQGATNNPTQKPSINPVTSHNDTTVAPVKSPTKTPITSNLQYIIVENDDSTQEYYLSFVLKNIYASECTDYVSDIQILEENSWRSYDQSYSGNRYAFKKENVKFSDMLPISIRIIMSSGRQIFLSNIIADLMITSVFISNQLICDQVQTQTITPSSNPNQIQTIDPTRTPSSNPTENHLSSTQDNDGASLKENTNNQQKGMTLPIVVVILGLLLIIAVGIGIYFYRKKKSNVVIVAQASDKINVEMIDGKFKTNGETETLNTDNDIQQNIIVETK